MQNLRGFLALGMSLCLHALLLLPLKSRVDMSESKIEVEMIPRSGFGTTTGHRKSIPLKHLVRRYGLTGPRATLEGTENSVNDGGTAVGFEKADELYPSLRWIFQKIDMELDYPDELIEYENAGRVVVDVDLSSSGFVQTKTVIAVDRVLKVYVLRVLQRALNTPLPPSQSFSSSVRLRLIFDFVMFSQFDAVPTAVPIVGNQLQFLRSHYRRPWLPVWQTVASNQVSAPVPGMGVSIDFMTIYNDVRAYLKKRKKRKLGFEPLENY